MPPFSHLPHLLTASGQLLASAWSDGTVRLLDPESNKVAHQLSVSEGGDNAPDITCLAWATNLTVLAGAKGPADAAKSVWQQMLAEEKLELAKLLKKDEAPLDLPRDIALLDVEPSLPKISTLPSGGTVDDIFSTRASLDSLFRPFDPRADEAVDVMVVGTSDGNIHLSIYDSFVVGSFPSPIRASRAATNVLVSHASHKAYSVHGLLLKSSSTLVRALSFVPMDLRFITSSKDHLSLLASRSTALQNLLRYVNQVKDLMATEYNTSRDLPSKFIRNVDDAFAESGKGWGIVPALYHQVVTGHTLPEVKEWLSDIGERGYKRWDKAVSTSLNNLRSHIHKKLIPTLQAQRSCTLPLTDRTITIHARLFSATNCTPPRYCCITHSGSRTHAHRRRRRDRHLRHLHRMVQERNVPRHN